MIGKYVENVWRILGRSFLWIMDIPVRISLWTPIIDIDDPYTTPESLNISDYVIHFFFGLLVILFCAFTLATTLLLVVYMVLSAWKMISIVALSILTLVVACLIRKRIK